MSGSKQLHLIVKGDTTDHGGTVITAMGEGEVPFTIDGIPVAGVGDWVYCPKCKGTFQILMGANNMRFMGKLFSRHGDKTGCGAHLWSVRQQRVSHVAESDPPPQQTPSYGRTYTPDELAIQVAKSPLDHPGVMALAGSSGTLSKQIKNLPSDADVRYTNSDIGSRQGKTIKISKGASDKEQTRHLSHEIGHYYGGVHADPRAKKSDFVDAKLEDEGAATLNTLRVREEIMAKGGPDIGITPNSNNAGKYEAIYNDLKAGNITETEARRQIGDEYRNKEFLWDDKAGDYITYEQRYGQMWDEEQKRRGAK
jgi:uncharacterized Zn-binding protein involved in type VI secretion